MAGNAKTQSPIYATTSFINHVMPIASVLAPTSVSNGKAVFRVNVNATRRLENRPVAREIVRQRLDCANPVHQVDVAAQTAMRQVCVSMVVGVRILDDPSAGKGPMPCATRPFTPFLWSGVAA